MSMRHAHRNESRRKEAEEEEEGGVDLVCSPLLILPTDDLMREKEESDVP